MQCEKAHKESLGQADRSPTIASKSVSLKGRLQEDAVVLGCRIRIKGKRLRILRNIFLSRCLARDLNVVIVM